MFGRVFRYTSQMRFQDVITVKEGQFARGLHPDLQYLLAGPMLMSDLEAGAPCIWRISLASRAR